MKFSPWFLWTILACSPAIVKILFLSVIAAQACSEIQTRSEYIATHTVIY